MLSFYELVAYLLVKEEQVTNNATAIGRSPKPLLVMTSKALLIPLAGDGDGR
jgi:hypothetical protein